MKATTYLPPYAIIFLFALWLIPWQKGISQEKMLSEKIGLTLSGGGVKGFAQIGALKVLEAAGFRPDIITGTSIGSILGGLYAIGYSIEDLEDLAMDIDWAYYFDDELERIYFPIEERYTAERYQVRFLLADGKVHLPAGIVRGKKWSILLSRLTIPAHGIYDFDQFDIPFRAVATDLETGEAITFARGDLAEVMRASMSIPSVFVPARIGSMLLIDGGVSRNLPVQDAIHMGADKVIAIDIGASLYKGEAIQNIFDILDQTSSYRIVESNRKQATLADLIIRPDIQDIGALSFGKNDTLIMRGMLAARKYLPQVKALLKNRKPLHPRKVYLPSHIEIKELLIEGADEKQSQTVMDILQLKAGKGYALEEIENSLKKLYGSELVAMTSYRLLPSGKKDIYTLLVKVEMQKGEFVRLSANYDSRLKAALLMNLTLRNRIFSGSKFNLDFKLSENPSLFLDYYIRTSHKTNIGLHLNGTINFFPGQVFEEGLRKDIFDIRHLHTSISMFSNIRNRFLLSSGIGLERYVWSEEYFNREDNNLITNQVFNRFQLLHDSYDRKHFPTKGYYFVLEGKYGFRRNMKRNPEDLHSNIQRQNMQIQIRAHKAIPVWESSAATLGILGGYTHLTENNYFNRFYLGRALYSESSHIDFAGLNYMELPVSRFVQAHGKWQMEISKSVFLSLLYNTAYYQVKSYPLLENGLLSGKEHTESDFLHGIAIELGAMTRLGPATFSTEYNFGLRRLNVFLHMGYDF